MKKYYTGKEVSQGIILDGIEIIPPISETTLRNARQHRQIMFSRLSRKTIYTVPWLQAFIDRNIVEVKCTS